MGACLLAAGCAPSEPTMLILRPEQSQSVNLPAVWDAVLSWHIPQAVPVFRGARLLADAPRPASAAVALTKSIIRSNPRLSPLDALRLAILSERSARHYGLNQDFFGATILQESGFDPFAMSSAGALGIAQFMLETADAFEIDPLNPREALAGSAELLATYVARYRVRFVHADPYALALAAYNAGPLAVAHYEGVPPYSETRDYIGDIYERIARIVSEQRPQQGVVAAVSLRRHRK
jgi:soluble lytic murein transglycosylase-like protein